MRTRRGNSYYASVPASKLERPSKRARLTLAVNHDTISANNPASSSNRFGSLPEDLLLSIFVCVSRTSKSPLDLLGARRTCKKFNALAMHPLVLSKASLSAMEVKASKWCDESYGYLKRCAESGNVEACYTLGMIRFYCEAEREEGIMWMSKAAKVSHPCALHSLAVIQFNGSGGARKHKNLKAGVSLCARAASLGHIDAMRELGHCLQDGYGISRNVLEGRKLLLEANAREAAAAVTSNYLGKPLSGQALQLTATRIAIGCFHHHFLCNSQIQGQNQNQIQLVAQNLNLLLNNNNNSFNHHQHQQQQPQQQQEESLFLQQSHHLLHQNINHQRNFVLNIQNGIQQQQQQQQDHELEDQAQKLQAALYRHPLYKLLQSGGCSLLSDFGCNVPPPKLHPCHKFLVEWFSLHPPPASLRLCSHQHCGRPETRRHEFRRCSACGTVNYCSRACQALDWKLRHKFACVSSVNWPNRGGGGGVPAAAGGGAVAGVAPIAQPQQNNLIQEDDDAQNF